MELLLSGNLAESLFNEHLKQTVGEEAIFVNFGLHPDTRTVSIDGLSYKFAVGRLAYRESPASGLSAKNLLVKYFEASESEPGFVLGYLPFQLELHFFQSVLPMFDEMKPTKHLFAKFCMSCTSATTSSNRSAIIFEWPRKNAIFEKIPSTFSFGYSRCSLMLKRIAQFHAGSLLMKQLRPARYEEANFACPETGPLSTQLVLPSLVRCLQPLQQDRRMDSRSNPYFRHGVTHLAQILENFDHHLRVPLTRSSTDDQCWVLCHQNYGQHSVIFEYVSIASPTDMKIINCQSMGFASLGVDLVIPLFVEVGSSSRTRIVDKLLIEYHTELQQMDYDLVVPSMARILTEIKNSIPFALYVLASRILQAQSDLQSETSLFKPNLWKEALIIDLYKYLIYAHFV